MFRHLPNVRQNDVSDCGAAAIASVALYYRIPIGMEQIRDLAGTDRSGTNLTGMLEAAERLGFFARAVGASFESLTEIPLPAIAHMKTEDGRGHFVVLYRVGRRGVVLADPARGLRKLNHTEFSQNWSGYLLLLVPDWTSLGTHPGSDSLRPGRRFVRVMSSHWPVLLQALCCALLMTVLGVSTSYFVQHLIDSVLVRDQTTFLNALGIGMLLVVVFRTLFGVLRQYLMAHVGRNVDLMLIAGYAHHILSLPMRFFEMRRLGEILARVNDVAKVREAVSGMTLTLAVDGVLVGLLLPVLWLQDAQLATVATLFVPVMLGSVLLHHPRVNRCSRQVMENAARLSAHLVENISGVETIKAFGLSRKRNEMGESLLLRFVQNSFSLQMTGVSMSTTGAFVTGISGIVILWFGGYRVIDGALSIGQLMFFYSLLGYMLGPLERLALVNLQLQDALVAIERLYQIMDVEVEQRQERNLVDFGGLKQAIEFRDLSFKYGCRGKVLENVTMRIPAGQTVAIVGESGCGKSTLLKLLMRFYDPNEGVLLFDGVDSRDVELESLRTRIGLVSQDPFIFNGTVRENIALNCKHAAMQDIIAAAQAAGLHRFISQLPDRYETRIGERGANLSGGQRQRLAIARCLLRNPSVLLFDEATSHLDTATERDIQRTLKTTLAGTTFVLVTHRLSTIRGADLIYVLDKGKVVESGTHRQLVRQGGKYSELWRAQSEVIPPKSLASNGVVSHHGAGRTFSGVRRHEL